MRRHPVAVAAAFALCAAPAQAGHFSYVYDPPPTTCANAWVPEGDHHECFLLDEGHIARSGATTAGRETTVPFLSTLQSVEGVDDDHWTVAACPAGASSVQVSWGDGTSGPAQAGTTHSNGSVSIDAKHSYAAPGTYTVTATTTAPGCVFALMSVIFYDYQLPGSPLPNSYTLRAEYETWTVTVGPQASDATPGNIVPSGQTTDPVTTTTTTTTTTTSTTTTTQSGGWSTSDGGPATPDTTIHPVQLVRVRGGRTPSVTLRCPSGGQGCSGSIAIRSPAVSFPLGTVRWSIKPGATRTVRVHFGRFARQAITRAGRRLRATLTVKQDLGRPVRRKITIR